MSITATHSFHKKKILALSKTDSLALLILCIMFVLMFFSQWNDSATMDELAHIPAGYSYLTQKDYRLNPEHPPLIKDLAAAPLLLLKLKFPTDIPAWRDDVNGQWEVGRIFLYESGNDADKILRFSRFPIMLLALLFGWMLFGWSRKLYGNKVGLLTLFFFAFSPTFIAHSRYVTTDLAAAFGFFLGISTFLKFLERQNKKHLIFAATAFGAAQLLKFSLFLLVPVYFILGILWVLLNHYEERHERKGRLFKEFLKMFGKILIIGAIGFVMIWLVYQLHIINYPANRQVRDTEFILGSFGLRPIVNLNIWMAGHTIFRPLGQYFLGLLMVLQRSAGGNTAYFMGGVSSTGWWHYFPFLYLLKESLAFHILALIALIFAVYGIAKSNDKNFASFVGWLKDNFALTASIIFISIYWWQSIRSPLNIGIRHTLPTFPFIYLLVSRELIRWLGMFDAIRPQSILQWLKFIYERYMKSAPRYIILGGLMFWMIISVFFSFPNYLSYYNELGGGTNNGYKYAVDSNYDWGQDLKRLRDFVNNPPGGEKIDKIALDYFGGGSPDYYLGERFEPWWSARGPAQGWFAISLTTLMGAQDRATEGLEMKPEDSYSWLKNKKPAYKAGLSIFIYKF